MEPIRFTFGVHVHQPVGNFDYVFEQHVREVYRPFLEQVARRGFSPSRCTCRPADRMAGPARAAYLDQPRRGSPATAGWSCCWPASTSRCSRRCRARTGWSRSRGCARAPPAASARTPAGSGSPSGCGSPTSPPTSRMRACASRSWTTVTSSSAASREQLHAPFRTEHGGKRIALFPIDERLRYLIPFQPPAETAAYLRELRERRPPAGRARRRRREVRRLAGHARLGV